MSLFDPLGLIASFVVEGKVTIQETGEQMSVGKSIFVGCSLSALAAVAGTCENPTMLLPGI